jgi:hypothetical protein
MALALNQIQATARTDIRHFLPRELGPNEVMAVLVWARLERLESHGLVMEREDWGSARMEAVRLKDEWPLGGL